MRDLEQLAEALRGVLPGEAITAVVPLTTGFSNETYSVEGPDLILRLPPSGGAMLDGHDVIGQARIYQELGARANGPPVPRVVTVCGDTAVIGVKFFVMTRIEGSSIDDINMRPWFVEGSTGLREQICRNWVSAFAGLAKLQPLDSVGPAVTPEDDARKWREFARTAACPVLVALYDALLAVPAPLSGAPTIVHGDTKLSNLMWCEGGVSAVLDWEMSLNGEPLADLGYMLYSFESEHHGATRAQKLSGMLSRDEVIALWSASSGRSAAGVFWHEIAQIGKIAAIIAEGTNMYNSGRSSDPKLAYFKQNLDYYIGVMRSMLADGRMQKAKDAT